MSQPTPYPLRIPDELREQLTENARKHGRSLNAEILGILQEAVNSEASPVAGLNFDTLAEAIATRVAAKLADSR